jgi:hypothetical protein
MNVLLVLVNPTQTYLSVEEGLTYYVTVRALTGHDCVTCSILTRNECVVLVNPSQTYLSV